MPPTAADALPGLLARTRWPQPLRKQQVAALTALDGHWFEGARRGLVVLPPGAGKTLVGLEAARRLGRRTVVFGPNTAIQGQWVQQWSQFTPPLVTAGTHRTLVAGVTALTYQSLANFDPDAEVDEDGTQRPAGPGRRQGPMLRRLNANGRRLIEELAGAGPLTLVLDECHHLLEVWGRLLADVLDLLPGAYVIALTATPPGALTAVQAELTAELFGGPLYSASIPAVVRDGDLAPFSELAWLTEPSAHEHRWLREQAQRFGDLTADLTHPDFATLPFLHYLDARLVHRSGAQAGAVPPVAWSRLERDKPELARAALRLHHAGLLALPEGARLREEHRQSPTADDWVVLIDDYVRAHLARSAAQRDTAALARLKEALPSIGFVLTRNGIRAGRSPVDRVLARSEAKMRGAVEIAAAESEILGSRARILVLADHERATATLPANLVGVLAEEAGSARLALDLLMGDPRTAALDPMLVTGSVVATAVTTARAFRAFVLQRRPRLRLDALPEVARGVVDVTGSWSPRTWVPLATAFFESGGCRALVGTRGLLGEGWDARGVNVLIDLTTATTATAVVQTRGRALRTDPSWPEKVADIWSVVCVAPEHPKGAADWGRFVRKHTGYLAADISGDIVDGVTHVDPGFSPYGPPAAAAFDALNVAMLRRAEDRVATREAWRTGEPYRDVLVRTVRITGGRPRVLSRRPARCRPAGPVLLPAAQGATMLPGCPDPRSSHPWQLAPAGVGAAAGGLPAWAVAGAPGAVTSGVVCAAAAWWVTRRRTAAAAAGELLATLESGVDLLAYAYAVADALHCAGLSPAGAEAVEAHVDARGAYRVALHEVPPEVSDLFAEALDEVLSPVGTPRYVVPRYLMAAIPPGPAGRRRAGRAWLDGGAPANGVIFHAVPASLAQNARRADHFAQAWARWVSAGRALYTGSPEGAGVLATHRGRSPLDLHTALRVAWE